MNDRTRWALRGPVQACRIERTCLVRPAGQRADQVEERRDVTVIEFLVSGALANRRQYNSDGVDWTWTHEYDRDGHLKTVRAENTAGLVEQQTFIYDSSGRLEQVVVRGHDGPARISERYEYDANGQKKKTLYVDLAIQSGNVSHHSEIEGSEWAYSAQGAATITTLHNPSEQPIEVVFYDIGGRELSRVRLMYDDAGNLVEEIQKSEILFQEIRTAMASPELEALRSIIGADSNLLKRLHRYDAQRRKIETQSSLFGSLGQERKMIVYNDKGDVVQEITSQTLQDYIGDDEGGSGLRARQRESRSEARFSYEYDARGNWVKKVSEDRSQADHEFLLSTIERRELSYHD